MNEQLRESLEIVKESVLKAVPATAIYLFGSHAYGEPNADSDLDIYVVVPKKEMCDSETYSEIVMGMYKKVSTPVDLFLREESAFNYRVSAPTLERKIHREGIKVYG
ncbi:MAG: nucleotidyltransferase domain-containing protein [Oscillospiraceae bacterium]|jgi:predicted nucleotidyltransferase|nr:nucleotidyltransferase domain-containing protein [Oscillospiraceae bacterium]